MMLVRYLLVLLLVLSCKDGAKKSAETTISVVDSRGKNITLPKVAERIVVLFEPSVDHVYMLNAQDKLVGMPEQIYLNPSGYEFLSKIDERIKNKKIPTPSFSGRAINAESIVGLSPDLVVIYEADSETISQLEGLNINVFSVSSKDKNAIYDELKNLATLIGKKERAEELISYTEAEIKKMQSNKNLDKKVYYGWSKGRFFSTSGKGTLIDSAMETAGVQNACPIALNVTNISAETIYQWNPDLIILWNSEPKDVYNLKELQELPAVKNKQVFALEPVFYYDPHTIKFMLFAKQLQHWCNPENNKSIDSEIENHLKMLYNL